MADNPYPFGFQDEIIAVNFPSGAALSWVTMLGSAPKANAKANFSPTNFKAPSGFLINGFNAVSKVGTIRKNFWTGGTTISVTSTSVGPIGPGLTCVQNYFGIAANEVGPETLAFDVVGSPGSAGSAYGQQAVFSFKSFTTVKLVPGAGAFGETMQVATSKGVSTFGWININTAPELAHISGPAPASFAQESFLPSFTNFGSFNKKSFAVTLN